MLRTKQLVCLIRGGDSDAEATGDYKGADSMDRCRASGDF